MKLSDRELGIADLLAKVVCVADGTSYAEEMQQIIRRLYLLEQTEELKEGRVEKIGGVVRQYLALYAEYQEKMHAVFEKETDETK